MTRRRAPRPAEAAIRAARDLAAPLTPLTAVQGVWAEVVGEQLARVAEPVAQRGDTVVIECEGAVWAQELDLMQGEVMERLRARLGERAPAHLRFDSRGGGQVKKHP